MKKMVVLAIIVGLFIGGIAFTGVQMSDAKMLMVDADNKTCPVTGAAIKSKKIWSAHDGKRYWFSSNSARKDFEKSPGKYVGKASTTRKSTKKKSTATKSTKKKRSWY